MRIGDNMKRIDNSDLDALLAELIQQAEDFQRSA